MFDKVTSLIGTSLTTADLYKFMAEADKVRMLCVMLLLCDGDILYISQDGNGKIDYNEFVAMMKQY